MNNSATSAPLLCVRDRIKPDSQQSGRVLCAFTRLLTAGGCIGHIPLSLSLYVSPLCCPFKRYRKAHVATNFEQ